MDASDNEGPNAVQREIVIVPRVPGPLVSFNVMRSRRQRDDLDELIDELLPDVGDRPGWFDAGLVLLGAGLLVWAVVGNPPTIVLALAIITLALGCILPIRTAWRRVRQRGQQHRRDALLANGVAIDVSSPVARRLVQAYDIVLRFGTGGGIGAPAAAAAHSASSRQPRCSRADHRRPSVSPTTWRSEQPRSSRLRQHCARSLESRRWSRMASRRFSTPARWLRRARSWTRSPGSTRSRGSMNSRKK